ncbi:MAG: hypothetical protein V3U30_05015 [Thermoplasmata archaeon]
MVLRTAAYMEARPPDFYRLRELARALGEKHASTLMRGLERFREVPGYTAHYRVRVCRLLGYGYYATRHEGALLARVVEDIRRRSPAYRGGPGVDVPTSFLVDLPTSPWRKKGPAICRGCGERRYLEDLEDWPVVWGILCAACRRPGGPYYASLTVEDPKDRTTGSFGASG